MRPDERDILQTPINHFVAQHPSTEIVQLYKETETLRSGYVIASIAGQGPDLVYGPSDPVGIYEAAHTLRPMEQLFAPDYLNAFDSSGLLWYKGHLYQVADKVGNHLALVYNKKYISAPPETDEELIALGKKIQIEYGSTGGRPNVYGLAWNYTEPFFFIPFFTGFGGWIFQADGVTPALDSPGMIAGLRYIQRLRDLERIVPNESDYEVADALFKDGKTAMLINGDWSWAGYKEKGIDIGVAPLPKIVSSGLYCAPMTSPKGFSINANVADEKLPLVVEVLTYFLSEENQLETVRRLNTAPTRKSLYAHPEILSNEILKNSLIQIQRGRAMPVVAEMRAVWDAMRPSYQAVLGGAKKPEQAARDMQALAERKIKDMKE